MTGTLVVDVANVVGARADGWWRDRAGAARRLLGEIAAVADVLGAEVVVVLEGAARAAGREPVPGIRIVRAEGSGDDAIVAVVAAARRPVTTAAAARPVTVVTADRGLRARVAELGAETVGPRRLLDRLVTG